MWVGVGVGEGVFVGVDVLVGLGVGDGVFVGAKVLVGVGGTGVGVGDGGAGVDVGPGGGGSGGGRVGFGLVGISNDSGEGSGPALSGPVKNSDASRDRTMRLRQADIRMAARNRIVTLLGLPYPYVFA